MTPPATETRAPATALPHRRRFRFRDQWQDDGTGRGARRPPRIESVLLADEPYRPTQWIDPAVLPGHVAAAYPGQNPPHPPRRAAHRVPAPPAPGWTGPGDREMRNRGRQERHMPPTGGRPLPRPVAPGQQVPRPTTPNQLIAQTPAPGPAGGRHRIPHPTTPNQRVTSPMPHSRVGPRPPAPGPDPAWLGAVQEIWEIQHDARPGPYRQGPAGRRLPHPTVPGPVADDVTEAGQGRYRRGRGRTAPGRPGTWEVARIGREPRDVASGLSPGW
jgi:hypothetical protein